MFKIRGVQELKAHPFFERSIDWARLERLELTPPINPGANVASEADTCNFDEDLTNMPAMDSPVERSGMLHGSPEKLFRGFSYTAPDYLLQQEGSFEMGGGDES